MSFYDAQEDWDDDVAVADEIDPVFCVVCGDEIEDDDDGGADDWDGGRMCHWCVKE